MIKFFRTIRRRLLDSGSLRKYLIYALGEILLVVMGILIALQINNWNEARKDYSLEINYLDRLKFEIQKDTAFFLKEIQACNQRNLIIKKFSQALSNPSMLDEEFLTSAHGFFDTGWYLPNISVSQSTFKDLSSTGKLSIIKNVRLRDELIAYYAEYENVLSGFQNNKLWLLPIDGQLTLNADALQYDPVTKPLYADSISVNDLKQNRVLYKRTAAAHYWANGNAISVIEEKLKDAHKMLESLENELNRI